MPWKVNDVMEERFRLIEQWKKSGESISDLSERFQVSRKTVYKWLERYELGGLESLVDRSRRPHTQAGRTSAEVEQWLTDLRRVHPTWGPRKLRRVLSNRKPELELPAESTIALILVRHGLSGRRKVRRRAPPSTQPLAHAKEPNDVWAIDFKGEFSCLNGSRCGPLTMSDGATRFLFLCKALPDNGGATVKEEQIPIFRAFGLPARIRSDNGSPFASTGVGGLTKLSVWWVRLGIVPERIEVGEPQQNGRHERLHRTLEEDTARPPAFSVEAQQQRFDEFQRIYNEERPHDALDGDTPADRYRRSSREFPEKLPELEYPAGMQLRRADQDGKIRWKQARCRVGSALAGEVVGLEEIDDGVSRVWFGPVLLGLLDEKRAPRGAAARENSHWPPLQSPSGLLARRPVTGDDDQEQEKV